MDPLTELFRPKHREYSEPAVFTPYSPRGPQQAVANFDQIFLHLRNTAPERLRKITKMV